jgi:hypothetical protein
MAHSWKLQKEFYDEEQQGNLKHHTEDQPQETQTSPNHDILRKERKTGPT